ncbi:UNVERIFIED_CONTAM: hypothetical protein GTU68_005775 [Idotea baltica]|nr:hypothetical protein [Idotea baltica]
MLKGHPCKVLEYTVAKPGKHGSAKAHIVGNDIFTGKKYEDAFSTSHTVYVPIVSKIEYEVADISDSNFVSLLLMDFSLKEDLKLPNDEELRKELQSIWERNHDDSQVYFTVISACEQAKIVAGNTRSLKLIGFGLILSNYSAIYI